MGRLGVQDKQKPSRRLCSATAASRGQNGAAFSPQQSVPGRKEEAGAPGQSHAVLVPNGRLLLGREWPSHTTVTLWREKQERRMLCLLVTNSNSLSPCSLGNSRAVVPSGCLLPFLGAVCLSLVPPGRLCHSWMTDIDQECSLYSGE